MPSAFASWKNRRPPGANGIAQSEPDSIHDLTYSFRERIPHSGRPSPAYPREERFGADLTEAHFSSHRMPKKGSDFWNDRFSADTYVYGVGPNAFIAEAASEHVPPEADVVDVGAGEGRNAVYLATQGHRVTAVDYSEAGLAKTAQLAGEAGVEVARVQVDVNAWTPERTWDAVVVTFLHLAPADMPALYRRLQTWVRPGGVVLAEWFRPEQRTEGYDSGGPPDVDMMVTGEALREAFPAAGLRCLNVATPVLDEGAHHRGPAATIRLVWQRPEDG